MKMNKYILFPALAAGALCVSCTENRETPSANQTAKSGGGHAITIGAGYKWGGADEATRVMLDSGSGLLYWTPGDNVGLTITPAGSLTPIVHNVQMTGNQTANVLQTTFSGKLTAAEYAQLDPDGLYDYYSYFPYNAAAGTFPDVRFTIPATVSVRPNVLNPFLAPMVAKAQTGQPPQVFFSGSNVTYDQLDFNFRYDHIMSYAAIELDTALLPEPVTSIVITNQNDRGLAGTLIFNMAYPGTVPSWGWTPGSSSVTLEIEGGLTPGPGQVLYFPVIPANMSSETLTFEFRTGTTANSYITRTIPGTNFERGKIHTLSLALPARYTENTAFTISKEGFYSIEAWGGDGGRGGRGEQGSVETQSYGGVAQKASGCYYLNAGANIRIFIGTAGDSRPTDGSTGTGEGAAGGTNGHTAGNGGKGGNGYMYDGVVFKNYSGAGGGGGAATFILTGTLNLHISGGGAGGGGGAGNSSGDFSNGGNGGNGNGGNGSPGTNGGSGYGGAGATVFTSNTLGGNGGNGSDATGLARGGGGGGGGGGYYGGSGGSGGQAGLGEVARGGGGGKGGSNLSNIYNPNDYPLPDNPRANGPDGYVVITLLR